MEILKSNESRFIQYLESKNLSVSSINYYTMYVEWFFRWVKKEDIQVTKPDILKYLEYLKNRKRVQKITQKNYLIALNHYFTFLFQAEMITENPCQFLKIRGANKKQLHKLYTMEELELLFDNYYQYFVRGYDNSHIPKNQQKHSELNRQRNTVILSLLVHQGVRTNEIGTIKIDDLDLIKANIKIRNKKAGERVLPLKASQIGLFINYLQNIRPQLLEYQTKESENLFLPLPKSGSSTASDKMLKHIFKSLVGQVKTIDKQFLDFWQVRASVITFWLKTQGLRKTQYLAGHSTIVSTENYLPNDIDDLIDDINKLHPF
ncbi:MAG: tyrosine-type recombinase/integrase [Bacteroidales bacterium]|jgi:site-specific recombinase XerD|nr:tyrosine-type recombinase/integrase [Bacteroidales bacterium]